MENNMYSIYYICACIWADVNQRAALDGHAIPAFTVLLKKHLSGHGQRLARGPVGSHVLWFGSGLVQRRAGGEGIVFSGLAARWGFSFGAVLARRSRQPARSLSMHDIFQGKL